MGTKDCQVAEDEDWVVGQHGGVKHCSPRSPSHILNSILIAKDNFPIEKGDRTVAIRQQEQQIPIYHRLEEVDYLCSETGQRPIHQRWTKERLIAHPSKVIPKESFWDPDHPAPSDAPVYICAILYRRWNNFWRIPSWPI
jgi:hypothetical protein